MRSSCRHSEVREDELAFRAAHRRCRGLRRSIRASRRMLPSRYLQMRGCASIAMTCPDWATRIAAARLESCPTFAPTSTKFLRLQVISDEVGDLLARRFRLRDNLHGAGIGHLYPAGKPKVIAAQSLPPYSPRESRNRASRRFLSPHRASS